MNKGAIIMELTLKDVNNLCYGNWNKMTEKELDDLANLKRILDNNSVSNVVRHYVRRTIDRMDKEGIITKHDVKILNNNFEFIASLISNEFKYNPSLVKENNEIIKDIIVEQLNY